MSENEIVQSTIV